MIRSLRLRGVVSAFVIAGLLSISPAAARAADAKAIGLGAACALTNVLYGPAKLMLALLGTLTAGLGYAVTAGDVDVARKILDSSVMGDYVIEPSHLTGEKKLAFIGDTTPQATDDWSSPPQTQTSGF
jgi:type IV secretory pathway VirB2 component (pilin)